MHIEAPTRSHYTESVNTVSARYPENAWQAVEPDGRVRLLPAACIALRLDESSCPSCRNACPVDCIDIGAGKFHVSEHCIGCGHCASACPTGALTVKGFDVLEPVPDGQALRVECRKVDRRIAGNARRVSCLGGLAATDWIEFIENTGVRAVHVVDRGWCGQCEVAVKMEGRHPASVALEQVTQWLAATGVPTARLPGLISEPLPPALMPRRIPNDAPAAPARRRFFLRLGNEAKCAVGIDASQAIPSPRVLRNNSLMPLPARERLLNLLQRLADMLEQPQLAVPFHALDVADACANHAICTGICPTQALARYADADSAGIEFDAVRCIGCGKCATACPEQALTLRQANTPPAMDFPVRLTAHAKRICTECLQAYFDSTDNEYCPTCRRNRAMGAALFKGF